MAEDLAVLERRHESPSRSALLPRYTRRQRNLAVSLILLAVAGTNLWVITGAPWPLSWLGAAGGFLLGLGLPAWMLAQKIDWPTDKPGERLGYGVVSAILALMAVALLINTVLPHLGVSHPLDRYPVLLTADAWCAALALWRPERFNPVPRLRISRLSIADRVICGLAALCVPLAVVGANRLNNNAGDEVTLSMLVLAAGVFIALFANRHKLNPGTFTACVYLISLSLLLMTSLRGWYVTGHDIQQEYMVFELTKAHGDWNIGFDQDAYNACMSITVMPTYLWQLIRVNDPYIFKFWFQLLFALCPVFVYRIALRHTNQALALIATVYFVAFPTFFTDMPFLNRQEIAFLFVGACVLLATDTAASRRKVRVLVGVLSVGVVLSHYSTAYVYAATLALAWLGCRAWPACKWLRAKIRRTGPTAFPVPAIALANVLLVLVGIGLWNGVATHTANGLGSTLSQAVHSLRGGSADDKSTTVGYSLFGGGAPAPSELLKNYTQASLAETAAGRAAGVYYPQSVLAKYPVTLAPEPNMPVTTAGKLVNGTGLDVATINSLTRSLSARMLQLFVFIGLAGAILSRRRRKQSSAGLVALGVGALLIVALQVVLPVISVDYGVLRAFQQAMIAFGVFIALGSVMIFSKLGPKWSLRAAFALAMLFFLSLTGVIPQLLGGYPAQLQLNNAGLYYDIYDVQPQEMAGVQWLQSESSSGALGADGQAAVQSDGDTLTHLESVQGISVVSDIFPTQLQKGTYVFLGYSTVTKGQATLLDSGDDITYNYPTGLLNSQADLMYSSNGTRIYRS
jgi:uncharacterized membrane protein